MQRLFVFDFDGTLVDSHAVIDLAFQHVFTKFGLNVDAYSLETVRALHPKRIMHDLVGEDRGDEAFSLLAEFSSQHTHLVQPYTGVPALLEFIKARKHALAIWTGRDTDSAERILRTLNLHDLFSMVVGGCRVPRNKPEPDGLHLISTTLQIHPSQFVVIGDHPHDIQGAKAVGARSIGVNWGEHPYATATQEMQPDHFFDSVPALQQWIQTL